MIDEFDELGLKKQKKLPNESPTLVLGILSICSCVAWGVPGLILGIIALVLHKQDKRLYESNPSVYEQSYNNSNTGKVCAIIGISLSAFMFVFVLIYFLIIGTFLAGFFSIANSSINNVKNQSTWTIDSTSTPIEVEYEGNSNSDTLVNINE